MQHARSRSAARRRGYVGWAREDAIETETDGRIKKEERSERDKESEGANRWDR